MYAESPPAVLTRYTVVLEFSPAIPEHHQQRMLNVVDRIRLEKRIAAFVNRVLEKRVSLSPVHARCHY